MQKAILRNIKSVNPLRKDPDMTIVFSLGNNEKGKKYSRLLSLQSSVDVVICIPSVFFSGT